MRPTELERADAIARDMAEPMDAADLAAILNRLDDFSPAAPLTPPGALIERLRGRLPAPSRQRFREDGLSASPLATTLQFMLAQVWLFRPVWWGATTVATLIGLALTKWVGATPGLLVPPLVAFSLAYSMREAGTPAWEVELSCPVRPYQVVLARALVVLGWMTVLGAIAGSILHFIDGWQIATLGDWLAGMLLFAGASLLGMVCTGPRLGAALVLAGWVALGIRAISSTAPLHLWVLPNTTAALLGAACLAGALLMAPRFGKSVHQEG